MTNCQTCTSGSTCLSCQSPYYLRLDGTCQADCSSKQQDKDGNFKCKLCNQALPNCLDCNLAGTVCNQCETGYFIQANTCQLCSSYLNDCVTCSDISTCTKCSTKYLYSGECQDTCPSTQQDKNGVRICKDCSLVLSNCLECSLNGLQCTKCNDGFHVGTDFQCHQCLVTNCKACLNQGTVCSDCFNPLKLEKVINKCSSSCPITEQDKDGDRKCQLCSSVLSNCIECTEDGLKCSVCGQNSVLQQEGLCYPCSSIDANCIICSDKNTCTECNSPLKLSQNKCVNNCPIKEQDKDGDRKCKLCSSVHSNCIECTEDGIQCTKCNTTNVLEEDGFCYQCSSIDTNCISCSDKNTCTECSDPLKLSQNKCFPNCPNSEQDSNNDRVCKSCNQELNNCLQCSEDGIICLACEKGFYINSQDQCELCSHNIQNCSICSLNGSECFSCFSPLKLQSNICVDECFKNYYYDAQNICQFCNKKLSKNECKDQCSQFEQDIDKDNICQPCNLTIDNCQKCHETNETVICDACNENQILYENKCQECEFFFQDCVSCQNQNICLQCGTLYLSQNQCKAQCDETEQDYNRDKICQPCSQEIQNCSKCDEIERQCYECQNGFYLDTSKTCKPC